MLTIGTQIAPTMPTQGRGRPYHPGEQYFQGNPLVEGLKELFALRSFTEELFVHHTGGGF